MSTPTIPPSLEVLAEAAARLRAELEPLAARVVPLLAQVVELHDHAWAAADAVCGDPLGDNGTVFERIYHAAGIGDLDAILERIGAVLPAGTVQVDELAPLDPPA